MEHGGRDHGRARRQQPVDPESSSPHRHGAFTASSGAQPPTGSALSTTTGRTSNDAQSGTLWVGIGAALLLVTAGVVGAAVSIDFGAKTEQRLAAHSEQLFGVNKPLDASSTVDLTTAQALADPAALLTVAKGLKVNVISAGKAAPNIDQMVLWPPRIRRTLIGRNEEGTREPGLQKIDLETGRRPRSRPGSRTATRSEPHRGARSSSARRPATARCTRSSTRSTRRRRDDRPRRRASARARRSAGSTRSGFNAFEGLGILPNGVTYYGDESGRERGAPGGAYYKFVPTTPWAGGPPIT